MASTIETNPSPITSAASLVGNTLAQSGRVFGGIAQGTVKTLSAPGILYEAAKQKTSDYRKNLADAQKYISDLRKTNPYLTQADLIDALEAGEINQQQYDSILDDWRINGDPVDRSTVNGLLERTGTGETTSKPVTEWAGNKNTDIEKWTNSWVPAPQSGAAEFAAKAADALGEAVPATAVAIATGGASTLSVMAGTTASHATGAANAISTEMLEGSGDVGKSLISGGTEWASEAIGGALFNSAAAKIENKVGSLAVDAIGEGLEEIMSGGAQALLTGQDYALSQAAEEFALGATVGLIMGTGAEAINTVSSNITEGRVQSDVNSRIADTVKADVADVQQLLSHANDSGASAVVAQDSLTALQKQVANPVNTTQTTTSIPTDIAAKYNLVPTSEGSGGKPLTIQTQSYESVVAPAVAELSATEISLAERAGINPNDSAVTNARALYQYAPDIYLQPGTDVSSDTMFTYRGQGNQFYSSSQEAGSIPASGVGMSWEGSGVYSAPTPYTTDLYGPSGKLMDNPYSNRGINQTAIDVDYPVGVILEQSAGLSQDTAPLTRADAPGDVVAEGTRRTRYDPGGNLVTEVINNPMDVSAAGLIFGRTGVSEATPIQYATGGSISTVKTNISENISNSGITENSSGKRAFRSSIEEATGTYTIPDAIRRGSIAVGGGTGNAEKEAPTATESSAGMSVETATESTPAPIAGSAAETPVAATTGTTVATTASEKSRVSASTETSTPVPVIAVETKEPALVLAEEAPTDSTPEIEINQTNNTPGAATLSPGVAAPETTSNIENPANAATPPLTQISAETLVATDAVSTSEITSSYMAENTTETAIENRETPATASETLSEIASKAAGEELSAEELASEIWTPVQSMANASAQENELRRKEKEENPGDSSITKGPGSTGRIYETASYNTTFGGLSSL